jgi:hypothetical protein
MMDQQKIERYVEDLLTVSGILKDGAEQPVWLLLHHLYSAVAMYELMNPQQRALIAGIQRKLRYFFDAKCDLKERKRKQEKENTPPHPLYKEKARKEKEEKNIYIEGREAFHQECLSYVNKYDVERLADFYNYWSEVNEKTGKMRFEKERYWNTERRLKRWMNTSYSADNSAAALRLEREKKKTVKHVATTVEQQAIAAKRAADNARLEQEIRERKAKAVSHEEYLKMKEA